MGWGPENGVFPKTLFFCLRVFWACMRAKPQFRQDFSLIFFKIAKTVFRAVPGLKHVSALRFWGLRYLCACMRAKPQFRQHSILTLLDIRAHVSARSGSDSVFFCLVKRFWIFVACMRPKPPFWHQLVLNLISLRVPRAYAHQRIHAQSIVTFVFQEHAITAASMPKPYNSVLIPRACARQRSHAQTIITFMFQEQHP